MPKKKIRIKAILFDFDGTLVDSEKIHFQCWKQVLSQYGLTTDYETFLREAAGIPALEHAELVTVRHSLGVSAETMVDKAKLIYSDMMKIHDVEFMPFAMETLQYFHKKGFPMALVTGSIRPQVDPILKEKGIEKYFKTTITYDDVAKSKPDPEGYLKAAEFLGFAKAEYLVFEDTANGTKAAKAAGLTCYAIHNDADLHQNLAHADNVFLNLKDAVEFLVKENLI
ncbi:HAD family phosphatase [Flavobacteriaceae bacterium F89]|uniref:HAD family phosphatase n=1 Tax=Cerina litoralis TaxID=2874477 RepID=A0AAE3ETK6_9FLAO|nr:HAD family phosphatase [Cerina litoralis]MCG2459864.1 HAD family phosphatase [Cerina litoralis]